jgi:phage-related protein
MIGQEIVMPHSFIKKTQKTPDKELRIAKELIKELKNDYKIYTQKDYKATKPQTNGK